RRPPGVGRSGTKREAGRGGDGGIIKVIVRRRGRQRDIHGLRQKRLISHKAKRGIVVTIVNARVDRGSVCRTPPVIRCVNTKQAALHVVGRVQVYIVVM